MSTEPLDIYEYRAALLAWQQENIGQTQRIYLAEDSHALLHEIRDDVLRHANALTHHYAQVINAAELSVIQQHFAAGEPADSVWNHEDIQQLLRDLMREKQDSLAAYCRFDTELARA